MISDPFYLESTPFFEGVFSADNTTPYTVQLAGHTFPIDVAKYRRQSQETLRDGVVQSNEPNDVLFNAQGAWGRYRYSWFHGAGQPWSDLRDDADPYRFEESLGVNVWNDGAMTLQPYTIDDNSLSAPAPIMVQVGSVYYYSDGASATSLIKATPESSYTACTSPGGSIQAMCTDGTDLYVATSTVMVKYVNGATTPTAFGTAVTGNCTNIAFVANRLLMAKANVLYEVAATGALTTIRTHYQSSFRWTTIFNIGSRIYIGGFAGTRSELYSCVVDDTGVIVQGAEAAPLPSGELLRLGASYAGIVLLGTNRGLRMASLGSDGTLTYGPLIDDMGEVRTICFEDQYAWTNWDDLGGGGGTCRVDLSTLTDTLKPAYASDVYDTTVADVTAIARWNGRTIYLKAANAFWIGSDTYYNATGYMTSGELSFGTVEEKGLIQLDAWFDALPANTSVAVYVYDETGTQVGVASTTTLGERTLTVDLDGITVRSCSVKVVLSCSGSQLTTPTFRGWRLRGYPIVPAVQQWVVPLQIFSHNVVNSGIGQDLSMEQRDEVEYLVALWRTKEAVLYREGDRAYRVRIDAYEYAPNDWRDAGDFFDGWMTVRLVEA